MRSLLKRWEQLPQEMYRNEVTLPLHTCLSDEQVEYLLECFAKVLKG